jgi:hypothetical protein
MITLSKEDSKNRFKIDALILQVVLTVYQNYNDPLLAEG